MLGFVYAQERHKVDKLRLLIRHEVDSEDPLKLRVEFINMGENEIKILKTFSNETNLFIWFHLKVVDAEGTPILGIPSGGKITMRGKKNYVTLNSKEGYSFFLDASKLVPVLKKGDYKLNLSYYNQYGEECFHGKIISNTIDIVIP